MIKCVLDEDGCVDLLAVMRIMNQVDQEQVWAIAYELAALMQRLWPAGNCALIESLAQIFIHRDGHIHEKSLLTLPLACRRELSSVSGASMRMVAPQEVPPPPQNGRPKPARVQEQQAQQQQQSSVINNQTNETTTDEAKDRLTTSTQQNTTTTTTTTTSTKKPHEGPKTPPPSNQVTTKTPHCQTRLGGSRSHHQLDDDDVHDDDEKLPPSPPITPELSELMRRRPALSESELVSSLGIALFWALDYGIPDDEERKLGMTMEYLIIKSQSDSCDAGDELSLSEILEICIKRLPIATKTNADLHYRQVCKSLIGDTMELSLFLDKIYKATMELGGVLGGAPPGSRHANSVGSVNGGVNGRGDLYCDDDATNQLQHHLSHQLALGHDDLTGLGLPLASLRALKIDEWARLWMQVIKEMRQRSKFKHLNIISSAATGHATELDCS